MPKRRPTDEIARQRQAEMKQSGLIKLLIGLGLLALGAVVLFSSFSTNAFIGGGLAAIIGLILAAAGWDEMKSASEVERRMYLEGR